MRHPRLVEGEVAYGTPVYGEHDRCARCGRQPERGAWAWWAQTYRPDDEDGVRPLGWACADCHTTPELRTTPDP